MTKREEILDNAKSLITGDRAESYGDFMEQMLAIAVMMNGLTGRPYSAKEIALMLMCLKRRRMTTSRATDSEVDLAGYAALYAEHFKGGLDERA